MRERMREEAREIGHPQMKKCERAWRGKSNYERDGNEREGQGRVKVKEKIVSYPINLYPSLLRIRTTLEELI
ncbi:Catechol oxidase [Sesbania bispinosa]|nr:Catechol oxidase [Sesbania bispinosa]